VVGVPFHPQEAHLCGPAALATALGWSGVAVEPDALVDLVYVPAREGALASGLVAAARAHGRVPFPVDRLEDLLAEVAAGHPVLVLQNLGLAWYPAWHYAVAVGYDLAAAEVVLRSGRLERRRTPLGTFERTWARGDFFALAVLPPDELPARATDARWLEAASGLERAGRIAEAEIAYLSALERWPESGAAWLALGNARHALGDADGAESAFRAATRLARDPGPAWNNLAQVLAERGRRPEALDAARRAVELGGVHAETYWQTLREIEGRP
jgi:tetratricopeptide (TPR) repeat protein